VTSEGQGDTERWVASKGVKYAYAYDKGGKLARFFGVKGIPHAALVDASGTVVWAGHPSSLDASVIEKSLSGALAKPLWEWAGAAKGVKSALLKRDFKAALDGATKLSEADGGPAILAAIQGVVKSRVEAMRAAYAAGDFLGAESAASALQRELAGLAEQADAAKVAADIKANKEAAPVIKAQKQIAKLRADPPTSRKDIDAALEDLDAISKKLPGTFAAKQASDYSTELRAARNKG
jgi:thioredoxin-like negative regulator of GroEL